MILYINIYPDYINGPGPRRVVALWIGAEAAEYYLRSCQDGAASLAAATTVEGAKSPGIAMELTTKNWKLTTNMLVDAKCINMLHQERFG